MRPRNGLPFVPILCAMLFFALELDFSSPRLSPLDPHVAVEASPSPMRRSFFLIGPGRIEPQDAPNDRFLLCIEFDDLSFAN